MTCSDGEGDGVGRAGVEVDGPAVGLDVDPGVEGAGLEAGDDDACDLTAEGLDGGAEEVVGAWTWDFGLAQGEGDGLGFGHAYDDGEGAATVRLHQDDDG
jgi:hypothetical protein